MKKRNTSESGIFNLRLGVSVLLCCTGLWMSLVAFAAPAPAGGTLSTSSGQLTFTDSTPLVNNPTGEGIGFAKPNCTAPDTCSTYALTLDHSLFIASGNYSPATTNVVIQISWPVSASQYGSFVEDKNGNVIASNTAGINPESITIPLATPGLEANGPYSIITTAEIGTGPSLNGTISLVTLSGAGQACTGCTAPRYQMYEAPSGTASKSGEPSIGVDWNPNVASLKQIAAGNTAHGPVKLNTGGITLFTATFDQYRVGFDDCSSPAEVTWTDVAFPAQQIVTLDAIGFTDHFTSAPLGTGTYDPANPKTPGRTFHGQLTAGDSNTSYTDDDGNSHIPSQGGGIPQGPDHETIGAGPYAPTNPTAVPPVAEPPHPAYQNAVYYCTQNVAPEAECSRSDDGGLTFGPGVPIYTPTQCTGSIHGHVKVARDGTVYVPNYSCTLPTGNQGVAVSTDNGVTWSEHNVPGSGAPKPGLVDPSVGIGLNDMGKPQGQTTNTIYLGYIDNDGTPKVSVSHDRGVHFSAGQNVGAAFGIVNSTFPVVVAGDDNRAAFGFLGTTTPGDSSLNPNFPGIWHLYIATSYDAGNSWITIDATPDDPVQVGPVCNGGTTCPTKRNLLDFNGFDVDSEGRGVLGLSDGCVGCTNSSSSGDSNAAQGMIARQSGGPRLFSFFDPPPHAAPAAPRVLSATPTDAGVQVSWLEPDNGGDPITSYKVYRGTTSGSEILVATIVNDPLHKQTKYLDTTASGAPNYFYHVTATNVNGESAFCEEVSLVQAAGTGSACAAPYITMNGPGTNSATATKEQQIQYVAIGEPFVNCNENSITFTMKVPTLDPGVAAGGPATGQAAPPPNTEYEILWNVTDTNGNPKTIFVEMDTNCPFGNTALPEFAYGRRDPGATGTFDQAECSSQPGNPAFTCPALTASYTSDGLITIKLDVSQPLSFSANSGAADATEGAAFQWDGHKVGTKLGSVSSSITLFAGCGAGFLEDLSSSSGSGYTRVGNISCSGLVPTAMLVADPTSGTAPLTVSFDASKSSEPAGACGTINSYTLDFGDGSAPVTQADTKFQHTYANPGSYNASLTVGDTAGQISSNAANAVITATAATQNHPPTAVLSAAPTSGNAPLTVHFDGSGSGDPDTSDLIKNYTFSFGDNTPNFSSGAPTTNHLYTKAGQYTATLIVTDSRGASSQNTDTNHTSISVTAAPSPTPSATASPSATAGSTPSPTATVASKATPTITTQASANTTSGGSVSDTATLGGGNSPTGNITFQAFGPDDATCGAGAVFTSTVAVNGDGNYTSASFTPTKAGTYRWVATYSGDSANARVTTACNEAHESVVVSAQGSPTPTPSPSPSGTPTVSTQSSPDTMVGDAISDTASLSGGSSPTGNITFQVFGPDDDACGTAAVFTSTVAVDGAGNYTSASFTPTAAGTYRWVATYSGDSANQAVSTHCGDAAETVKVAASPSATPSPTPANVSLLNISGRVVVQGGDTVGIGGFIISGNGSKRILARGVGPSLNVNGTPVEGRMQDPVLEIHDTQDNVLVNDNWRDAQEAEIQDTGLAPSDDHEAAIVKRFAAGKYTAVLRAANGSTGIGLVEVFDLSASDPGELGNLSVRALVQTNDNVLIDGVILRGGTPKRVVFRALGPELTDRGVQGALADPTLDVYDQNGTLLRTNDNWHDDPSAGDVQSNGLAPTNDQESATLLLLSAGNYTSIVRGVNGTTGVALNEIFKLD